MPFIYLSDGYLLGMGGWLLFGALSFWLLLSLRRRWKGRKRRTTFVHAVLSLWFTCAVLTGIELYFATIYDQSDSFNSSNVSKKWFVLHVEPDKKALRFENGSGRNYRDDQPYPEQLKPNEHHICFIGDSFTFGHGVPDVKDRFSNRIRAMLETKSLGKFVVSNLADAGRDLIWVDDTHKELVADGRRIDTLVYVMCLNDIETLHEDRNKFYERLGARGSDFFLFSDTYFFNLLYLRAQVYTVPEVKDYYAFVSEYYNGEPWPRMRRILDRIHQRCREHGTDFRIVIFPFLHNLESGYRFEKAHRIVAEYCRTAKIPVLDLAPVLKPHIGEGLIVNRFDSHPNERAHELAATAILDSLLADIPDRTSQPGKLRANSTR